MSDDLMNEIAAAKDKSSIIMVVGVGGAGGNAVNHMWNLGIKDVGFMVCNTDAQALDNSPVEEKVQLGREGLGAGNDPENGRKAAIESLDDIRRRLEAAGTRMLFVTAGMGGGTGTGASPVIAKLAHEMGILTVGIVTSPLAVEGKIRYEQAFRGIEELSRNVDSLLVINNENIVEMYGRLSLKQAFGKADDILASAAKGIAEIITVESDMVNVDFADVSKVMRDSGRAHMSVATAEGEHRAAEVARTSLESPLLDHTLISGAKNILLNISTSDADSLALDEVMEILKYIQSHASVQAPDGTVHDANIIWGTSVKPQLGRRIELVVVATGFDSAAIERAAKPVVPPADILAAQPREENTVLEPIKPRPVPTLRPMTQVMLGERPTRYKNIEAQLAVPAYRTRKAELIVETSTSRKEVLKEEGDAAAKPPQEKGGSLFD
ncbi:MAG: cell division protein FtsZ [Alistipes communis]|jgi:cell division protein FtsZ|uniref:cell division protein FtsZ n=1 Tax=Alistipes communis TaxID=2585118 RepID=UPI001DA8B0DF|nr:cell division protein FtsZ [Alistipes communis]MBD9351019.1 cell division protein FtsZ [Alistipes communis]